MYNDCKLEVALISLSMAKSRISGSHGFPSCHGILHFCTAGICQYPSTTLKYFFLVEYQRCCYSFTFNDIRFATVATLATPCNTRYSVMPSLQCHFLPCICPRAFLDLLIDLRVKCSLNHRRSIPRLPQQILVSMSILLCICLTSSREMSQTLVVLRLSKSNYNNQ